MIVGALLVQVPPDHIAGSRANRSCRYEYLKETCITGCIDLPYIHTGRVGESEGETIEFESCYLIKSPKGEIQLRESNCGHLSSR